MSSKGASKRFSDAVCQQARLSRDARFDGRFFTAVKTTQIYCRSICPAVAPKDVNVVYYASAIEAANAGFRPCLRCRPDSAPHSPAWSGVNTSLERALRLIREGELQSGSLKSLASRLGLSDRYVRALFKKHLGVSPKAYALYQQCLFAKQLLHQTSLPITDIALASGFKSVRRFNDCFKSTLRLTPSQLRKHEKSSDSALRLKLYFRPPYDGAYVFQFLQVRAIDGLEWCYEQGDESGHEWYYGRTISWLGCRGHFTAKYVGRENYFDLDVVLDDLTYLKPVMNNIRRLLDLDVDIEAVDKHLYAQLGDIICLSTGLRLPGIWSVFEAGVRAILGQQVSVAAASKLLAILIENLSEKNGSKYYFPSPQAIADSDLHFFKMPGARKQTLNDFAEYYLAHPHSQPDEWLSIKGVGPWTVNYAKFRGLSDPDIYLGGDLGVKKAAKKLSDSFSPDSVSPWRSYLTLHLWKQLS